MPIRLNLLAEAQAAEEARRRDPVKRAIWIAAMLVAVMLIWSSSLYFKAAIARSNLGNVEKDISSLTNDYRAVTDNQKKLADINHRLAQLNVLTTNRFLTGTLMHALPRSLKDRIDNSSRLLFLEPVAHCIASGRQHRF